MAFYITTIHYFLNHGVEKCHKSQLNGHYTGILWAKLWKEVSATPHNSSLVRMGREATLLGCCWVPQ